MIRLFVEKNVSNTKQGRCFGISAFFLCGIFILIEVSNHFMAEL